MRALRHQVRAPDHVAAILWGGVSDDPLAARAGVGQDPHPRQESAMTEPLKTKTQDDPEAIDVTKKAFVEIMDALAPLDRESQGRLLRCVMVFYNVSLFPENKAPHCGGGYVR